VADFNGLLGADLYAVEAFPTLLRLLVEGLLAYGVKNHQVIGADVLASGLVQGLAAVTFFHNYETRHNLKPPH
jgi:hypothetical protein